MEKAHVSNEKIKIVENLKNLLDKKRTLLVASIRNIPALQYQEIIKKLRGKAVVKVPKKSLIFRALDSSENEELKKIKDKFEDSVAVIFSDLDSFDLAAELLENTTPARAKTGQIAEEDVVVEEGPTELLPGPAISELGDLGIQIKIEKGKINIVESKVVVKKGEKVSEKASEVLNKLGIKPFSVGFRPLVAYDSSDKKLYTEIAIDKEGTREDIKEKYSRALAFAVCQCYANEDTISFIIGKAAVEGKAMEKIISDKNEKPEAESNAVDSPEQTEKPEAESNTVDSPEQTEKPEDSKENKSQSESEE